MLHVLLDRRKRTDSTTCLRQTRVCACCLSAEPLTTLPASKLLCSHRSSPTSTATRLHRRSTFSPTSFPSRPPCLRYRAFHALPPPTHLLSPTSTQRLPN